MGAFYGSIQVRSEDRDAVKAAVESVAQESKRKFLLGPPLNGWIAVYPDDSGQDEACAAALAKRLNTILLQLIVHDDDVLIYNYFRNGELLNEYSSRPDYFEDVSAANRERLRPKPEVFRDLVNSPEKLAKISRLLGATEEAVEFAVEQDRMEELASLLGIQNTLTSYEYLTAGEQDGIKGWKQFVHIPDQTAEKTAKKEAEAALRREKQAWQKAGLLCNEWLPPCRKRDAISSWAYFSADPLNGGFIVLWPGKPYGDPAQLWHLQPPWDRKPPTLDMVLSPTHAHYLTVSPKGKWLALSNEGLRLWNWHERRLINDIQLAAYPVAFNQDETLLLCRDHERTFSFFSLESKQSVKSFQSETRITDIQALHPSNLFLVTKYRQDQLGIINLESGKLVKVLFSGSITDWSHLAPTFADTLRKVDISEQELTEWEKSFVRGSDEILNVKFSTDGHLLFCAATTGLRVHSWNELLAATGTTPKPLFAVTPRPAASSLSQEHYENFIYDVALDAMENRLLFCGIEGTIRFLNLNDGKTGVLIDPPGKSPIWRLCLSHDRKFICCLCTPRDEDRDHKPPRLQVWNYTALCKAAGL